MPVAGIIRIGSNAVQCSIQPVVHAQLLAAVILGIQRGINRVRTVYVPQNIQQDSIGVVIGNIAQLSAVFKGKCLCIAVIIGAFHKPLIYFFIGDKGGKHQQPPHHRYSRKKCRQMNRYLFRHIISPIEL